MAYAEKHFTNLQNIVELHNFYAAEWLEKCYQQLAYPNPHLEKMMIIVGDRLASNLKSHLENYNSKRQQALFTLLGQQYVMEHFPHHKYEPRLLEPPEMSRESQMSLLDEMQEWLLRQLDATCQELGYEVLPSRLEQQVELQPFIEQARSLYKSGLDRRMDQLHVIGVIDHTH